MKNKKVALFSIIALSIIIPGLVAAMLFSPYKISADYDWLSDIPGFNAFINSATAVFLILGRYFARQGEILWHKTFMSFALLLGTVFLFAYVAYHATMPSAVFGDINLNGTLDHNETLRIGNLRYAYLAILLSHILMSVIVVPFVLLAFYHAIAQDFVKHVAVVRYTWPIWLYVSITGVIVYFLASPYYPEV
ncbi:MAG: DUF420 domain-containing protein [Reichenbachiella sp.]